MFAIRHLVDTFIVIVLTCLAARIVANPFSTLRVFAPETVMYGKHAHVIVAVEDIGDKPFLLNVSTTSYIIALFITDPQDLEDIGRWRLTLDLNVELKRYELSMKRAPFKYAYYYLCDVYFWLVGMHEISVQLVGVVDESPQSAKRARKITVLQPESLQCVPKFHVKHCKHPWQPMHLDTAVTQHFTATIKSHCAYDGNMIYKWKLRDLSEHMNIANLGRTARPSLTVPSYHLQSGDFESNTINGLTMFVLHITALGYHQQEIGVARCYVVLETRPMKATIAGGLYRNVKAGWKVFLSAKPSRDYSQAPGAQSHLFYQWQCSSTDDPSNKACANIKSKGSILKLKQNALRLGNKYNFTLTVRSRTSSLRSSVASQIITVVSTPQIYLTILCRANCEIERYEKGEPVSLRATCLNCFPKAVNTYEWVVSGTIIDMDSTGTRVNLETPYNVLGVEVTVTSKYGRYVYVGTAVMQLFVNVGPTGGTCKVSPKEGYEYQTNFMVKCRGYHTEFTPIEYQFFADDILIYRCAARRRVSLTLPKTESLDILICDIFDVCSELSLPVSVKSMKTFPDADSSNNNTKININAEEDQAVPRLLSSRKTLIRHYLTRGDWMRGMLLTYITARTFKEIVDTELLDLLEERMESMDQLEQVLTIVHKLLLKMRPLDDEKLDYFAKMLGRIATNFGYIVDYITSWEMQKHAFFRVSIKLLDFISDFSNEARRIPLTKCHADSLSWSEHIHAADEHEEMPEFNLTTMKRIDTWLRANHYLDRTIILLGVCAALKHLDEVALRFDRPCCEMLVQHFDDNQNHELILKDKVHKVEVSSRLINEVRGAFVASRISFQVFRLISNRYWWYPDCRALTSSIITVNVYSERSNWNHDVFLKSKLDIYLKLKRQIPFNPNRQTPPSIGKNKTMLMKRINNTANHSRYRRQKSQAQHIMYGSFDADLKMRLYLTMMTPNSLIALQILYTDMPLRVRLKTHKQPTYYEIVNSNCTTTEGYVMKSIVSINPCRRKMSKLYIAFKPNIDMSTYVPKDWPFRNFSFQLEVRECNSWRYGRPDPRWTTADCVPALQPVVDELIHCNCFIISTYSATLYYTKARIINFHKEADRMITYPLPLIYALLLLLLVLMRYAKFMRGPSARNLIVECSRPTVPNERGSIVVQIHTGGQWNAGTSSNITLGFYSLQLGERQYVLYQDPFNPQVRPNTTYTLRLSSKDVRLPALLIVGHDQAGMHPAWYLRSIAVYDLRRDDSQIFPIEKWITNETVLMSSRAFNRAPDPLPAYSWCKTFRNYFEELFINWFSFQPVMGPWRYGTVAYIAKTRFQRSCVWISQFGASICLCILWLHFHLAVTEQPIFNLSFEFLVIVCILNYFLSVAIAIFYDRLPMH